MYIRGLIPRNYAELAKAFPIGFTGNSINVEHLTLFHGYTCSTNNSINVEHLTLFHGYTCSTGNSINVEYLAFSISNFISWVYMFYR